MTIWEKLARIRDVGWRKLAFHLPKRLAMWTVVHAGNRAIRGDEVVPEVTFMTVLNRMPEGRR
jgi:hypothetical protein